MIGERRRDAEEREDRRAFLAFSLLGAELMLGRRPEHYTCNICSEKGHWIQECPNRAERDAARPPRGDVRPIQRATSPFLRHPNPELTPIQQSGRMLVLPLEPQAHQAPDRLDRDRDVPYSSEGPAPADEDEWSDE